ncbi:MAG: CoA transferase, partial [Paeniglutamicibacter terrestris]
GLEYAKTLGLKPTIEVHNSAGETVGTQVRHPIKWTPEFAVRSEAPPQLGEHSELIRAWLSSDVESLEEFVTLALPRS